MNPKAASKTSVFLNVVLGACFVAPLGAAFDANAQTYPNKPVKVVVPWPAGAITDGLTRQLGSQVSSTIGQPLVIENRAGASGTIGANFVAKSAADGYTLLIASSDTHAINPNYYTKLPYALSDFVDVMGLAKFSYTISVGSHVPANNLKEFVALAKANPGKFSYATWGNGSLAHLGTELALLRK
ncbi:Bug family tripartite tricarboxylate transporter substrate binding protein [Caldimonas tepidiphila]|uniref:Bug family tripartite tricarboxylate transporter substrate binding protein n=1 Tax=Caldimonas tepidiphila TaxID=2315841 RepID=UPI001300BED3|nr:tripartite tricarboxylate transporter substrate binding protein [Caldimonas tepidiphila]